MNSDLDSLKDPDLFVCKSDGWMKVFADEGERGKEKKREKVGGGPWDRIRPENIENRGGKEKVESIWWEYLLTKMKKKKAARVVVGKEATLKSKRCSKKRKRIAQLTVSLQVRHSGQENQTEPHCNFLSPSSFPTPWQGELASFGVLMQRLHLLRLHKKTEGIKKKKKILNITLEGLSTCQLPHCSSSGRWDNLNVMNLKKTLGFLKWLHFDTKLLPFNTNFSCFMSGGNLVTSVKLLGQKKEKISKRHISRHHYFTLNLQP